MASRFDETTFPHLPEGWRTATDFTESFMLAAAMEYECRYSLNPFDPIGGVPLRRLPPEYRHDPFASLAGVFPRIAALPLVQLTWQVIDEYLGAYLPRPVPWNVQDKDAALSEIQDVVLGAHGASLLLASFDRIWGEWDDELSPIEEAFIAGEVIPAVNGGRLPKDGFAYMESVWILAFRLIERQGARHFINTLWRRRAAVEDILRRGAQRGEAGKADSWGSCGPGSPRKVKVCGRSSQIPHRRHPRTGTKKAPAEAGAFSVRLSGGAAGHPACSGWPGRALPGQPGAGCWRRCTSPSPTPCPCRGCGCWQPTGSPRTRSGC